MPVVLQYRIVFPIMLLVVFFGALTTGCGGASPKTDPGLETRVNELWTQIDQMQAEIVAQREAIADLTRRHEQDMEALRADLKNVLEYLNITLDHLTEARDLEKELGDVGTSAKRALKESLQQLLDLSLELIDKLDKEMQETLPPGSGSRQ